MNIATVETVPGNSGVYQVTLTSGVVLWVPIDVENADYIRVQAWVVAGGVISS